MVGRNHRKPAGHPAFIAGCVVGMWLSNLKPKPIRLHAGMKPFLRFISILLIIIGLSTSSFSQVWLESLSSNSIQFVVRSSATSTVLADSVAVAGNINDSGAGARFQITFSDPTLTVPTITIVATNLSSSPTNGTSSIGRPVNPIGPPSSRSVSFREGTLWDFGFEIKAGLSLISASSTIGSFTNGDTVDQVFVSPNTIHVAAYSTDVGVQADQNGLDSGNSATYTFAFQKTSGFNAATFNPTNFWLGSNSPSAVNGTFDFTAVFINTDNRANTNVQNNLGWDKVGVTFESLPIPEPSTYGLIGAGALVALAANRRRRFAAVAK